MMDLATIRQKYAKKNNYNLIDLPVNLGLAGAFQTGMKYAF